MPLVRRSASCTWEGSIARGTGLVSGESGAFEQLPVTVPSRMTKEGERAHTSPEELLAAAHAACFTMALGATLAGAGLPPSHLVTTATHALETEAGKWRIVSAELDVRGAVEGMEAADFTRAVNEAGFSCVISQAVRGNVSISTRAELVDVI